MAGAPTSFPYHRVGSALAFPRDEGWHRFIPFTPLPGYEHGLANPSLNEMEWVYLNAHVNETGGAGRHFVVFAAYFTQHLRFLVVRGWDSAGRPLGSWTGSAWGALMPSPHGLDLSFTHAGGEDTWTTLKKADGSPRPFCSRLLARDDAARFTVDLELVTTKAPYEAGGVGYLPFGDSGSFNYYSLTRLDADGYLSLTMPSGAVENVRVKGLGWFDHQWGPFFVTPIRVPFLEQYEWMSIQLESKDEFLLTSVWDEENHTPSRESYGGAGWVRPDGSSERIVSSELWRRTGFWRSPDQGYVYSSGWTFDAPAWGAHLVITPRHLDQLTPIVDAPMPGVLGEVVAQLLGGTPNYLGEFWEGSCTVCGTLGGAAVKGVAFAELIKRYDDPALEVRVVRNEPGLAVVDWRATNWDPQAPFTYRAYVEKPDGTVLRNIPSLSLPVLVLDDPALPRGVPLVIRVVAASSDGTLTGTGKVKTTLA
ncbi:MAG: lipocalin family protein [Myxococcaceae bacterium]